MKRLLFLATLSILPCATVDAQIYRVAQMNTPQIAALDKRRTVVIVTGGILENLFTKLNEQIPPIY